MNVRDYIEHLRTKPEHERRTIAFSTAGGITLVVLLGWLTTLVSSGVLAFSNEGESNANFVSATRGLQDQSANVAGAAAAIKGTLNEGTITVVETKASSTLDTSDTGEATVIPF